MKTQVNSDNLLIALDIGTTKICVLVAQRNNANGLDIIGIGHAPSLGVSRGVVTDINQAVNAIKQAIKEAELMSGYKIESVAVGISGSHIQSINSNGMVPIKQRNVRPYDVATVIGAAKAIIIPEGQQILHVLPQYYVIDSQQKIMDPIGMSGIRLEAKVHIITGSISSVQNIVSCCQMSGVLVSDIILEPLASADAVLSEDEKKLGVALLDIGGGTSDFAIYQQGSIRHTKVFPIAGNHITHDIALCLRTTIKDAERVKREFGKALLSGDLFHESFEVEMVHGGEIKKVAVSQLVNIIEPRITELLYMIKQEINQQHLEQLMPAGIVLTGGGSLLRGLKEATNFILQVPARVGNPHIPSGFRESLENPKYSTGYGLLLHILKSKKNSMDQMTGPIITRILGRMKSWVSDFF